MRYYVGRATAAGMGAVELADLVAGETPTPAVDGVQTIFTTSQAYVAGTLKVTRGSLRMHPTADFSETDPAAGTFTMVSAPGASEPLIVDYVAS